MADAPGFVNWERIVRILRLSAGGAYSGNASSPAHFLPPPPSRPADVANWERAMFTDSNSAWLAAGGIAPAALARAALPPAALHALMSPFRRSGGLP